MVDYLRLSDVMIELSRCLISHAGVEQTLVLLCDRVSEVVPVRGTGVMLADKAGDLRFVAASDDRVREIEALQIELGEGPCLRAYQTGERIVAPDLSNDSEFPRFAPRAVAQGLRAVHSFPMSVGAEHIGALNLYDEKPAPFAEEDVATAQALADLATAIVVHLRTAEQASLLTAQLQQALDSRISIEQAKGRLAEQCGVDVDKAFEMLRRHARGRGLRLHDVAVQVASGQLRLADHGV
jgi:GAF domain-containing protein